MCFQYHFTDVSIINILLLHDATEVMKITTQYVLEKSLAENVKFIDAFHLIELLHHTVIIYVNVLYKLSATELDTGRTIVAIIITCDHYYTSG